MATTLDPKAHSTALTQTNKTELGAASNIYGLILNIYSSAGLLRGRGKINAPSCSRLTARNRKENQMVLNIKLLDK